MGNKVVLDLCATLCPSLQGGDTPEEEEGEKLTVSGPPQTPKQSAFQKWASTLTEEDTKKSDPICPYCEKYMVSAEILEADWQCKNCGYKAYDDEL